MTDDRSERQPSQGKPERAPSQKEDNGSKPEVKSRQQVELEAIKELGQSLLQTVLDAEQEKQDRRLSFEEKILEAETENIRRVTWGILAIVFTVLGLAAVLIFKDAVDPAVNLVVWMLSVVIAAVSGYGYGFAQGKSRGRSQGSKDDTAALFGS